MSTLGSVSAEAIVSSSYGSIPDPMAVLEVSGGVDSSSLITLPPLG